MRWPPLRPVPEVAARSPLQAMTGPWARQRSATLLKVRLERRSAPNNCVAPATLIVRGRLRRAGAVVRTCTQLPS